MTARRRLLYQVDNWRFWMTVYGIGLAFVVVALFFVNGRSGRALANTARDEAIHQAEIESARRSAVQQCLASRPSLIKINEFVVAVQTLHEVFTDNSLRALRATPKNDPQYRVRLRNYRQAKATLEPIERVRFPVPTKAECRKRR